MNDGRDLLRREGRAAAPFVRSGGVWRRLLAHAAGRVGVALALGIIVITIVGPFVIPGDPDRVSFAEKLAPPSARHPLGTDQYGRDQLTRIVDGGRRSLGAVLLVLGGVLVIGLAVGVTVGMAGGLADAVAMRVVDVLLAVPPLVLALAFVGVLGPGYKNLLLALIASSWAYYARLTRGLVVLARRRQDVTADRLAGVSWPRVVLGHIVPGVLAQVLIVATLDLGWVIASLAGLSFLGLGAQPPEAEWGAMLAESRLFFPVAPWLLLAPAAAILLTVVSANLIGNALRDAADFAADFDGHA